MKITVEYEGHRIVFLPELIERFDMHTLVQEKHLVIEADLNDLPRWEVVD